MRRRRYRPVSSIALYPKVDHGNADLEEKLGPFQKYFNRLSGPFESRRAALPEPDEARRP